ncbi:hypothetical protein ANCCAN_20597 [Ancylostoma caninum]|uniref:Uncharacterized protein n=1 Tax=Ancylostoma caninum TaxID=29170 RepID=A0A368FRW5_ANCCA|nr:hypothetical protein ANCCAN_20597 [Ancylostoma caninum]
MEEEGIAGSLLERSFNFRRKTSNLLRTPCAAHMCSNYHLRCTDIYTGISLRSDVFLVLELCNVFELLRS